MNRRNWFDRRSVVILLVSAGGLLLAYGLLRPVASPIPAVGGSSDGRYHLPVEPLYLQADPRWGDEEIGGTNEKVRAVGCTICCLSMGLTHLGVPITPAELNKALKVRGGYTERGWVVWEKVEEVVGHRVTIRLPDGPSYTAIDRALKQGNPVVTKVRLGGRIPHWVLIVGKQNQEYLIKDPLGRGKTLEKLSKFNSDIYSIRILEKTDTATR